MTRILQCIVGRENHCKKILGSDDRNNSKRAGLSSKTIRHPSRQVNNLSNVT